MALEDLTGTDKFIDNLVNTNPADGDQRTDGNKHIYGIKNVLQNTFPNISGAVTANHTELSLLDGEVGISAALLALAGPGVGTQDIDLNVYNRLYVNITGNVTYTISNAAIGDMLTFVLTSTNTKAITFSGFTVNGGPSASGSLQIMAFNMIFRSVTVAEVIDFSINGIPI